MIYENRYWWVGHFIKFYSCFDRYLISISPPKALKVCFISTRVKWMHCDALCLERRQCDGRRSSSRKSCSLKILLHKMLRLEALYCFWSYVDPKFLITFNLGRIRKGLRALYRLRGKGQYGSQLGFEFHWIISSCRLSNQPCLTVRSN